MPISTPGSPGSFGHTEVAGSSFDLRRGIRPFVSKTIGTTKRNNNECGASCATSVEGGEADRVLREMAGFAQHKLDTLASISVKAADVLKYVLTELNEAKRAVEELRFNRPELVKNTVKVNSVEEAAKYIGSILEDEPKGPCAGMCPKGEPGKSGMDHTDSPLIQMLFAKSKYAIDPGEMSAYRRPELDTDGVLAYEFVANVERKSELATFVYHESFVAFLYDCMDKTVRLFDEKVANLKGVQFLTKEQNEKNLKERREAVEYYKKAEPVVREFISRDAPFDKSDVDERIKELEGKCAKKCSKKCGKCRCHKDKKVENAVIFLKSPPQLKGFKEYLLDNSKYAIPSTRFQILADHVDRKSQKFVYELRFFQANFRKTDSYESVPFRVKMNGDCDERILRRFDKAVADLKFNTFKEKKNVR